MINEVPFTAVQPLQEAENVEVAIMDSLDLDDLVINSHANGTQPESLNDPAVLLSEKFSPRLRRFTFTYFNDKFFG